MQFHRFSGKRVRELQVSGVQEHALQTLLAKAR